MNHQLKTCPSCGKTFLQVAWIPARAEGYCGKYCNPPKETTQQWAIRQSVLTQVRNKQLDMLAAERIAE